MPDRCVHYQVVDEVPHRCEMSHGHDGEHQKLLEDGTRRLHWADLERARIVEVARRCDET